MHDKNGKEIYQYPFEMIDNIANTMKKLEKIIIDYSSDSEKSENEAKDNKND